MYEAQADTINVDDIAKNRNNRIILHRLRRNDTMMRIMNYCVYKITQMPVQHIIAQRGLMIWVGWDTSLVRINI